MKKTKKKFLSVLSAGLVAVQAVAPILGAGVGAVSEENLVRKATPIIDGELDQEYSSSYSVKLSDMMKAEKIVLTAFQMQESAFNTVYFDDDDNPTGYIKIYAEDGSEITPEIFADTYDSDYSSLPKDDKGSITCTFEWTDAGYASEYFADVTYSFLWDDEAVYVYASVTDKNPLGYTQEQLNNYFASGWSGRPWLIDCVYATLRIDNHPYTAYKVSEGKEEDGDHPKGEIYIDEEKSTPYTDITVIASGTGSGTTSNGTPVEYDGIFYYSDSGESWFDKETNSYVCEHKMTTLNDFNVNWYEYTFFTDDHPGGAERRALICDGSDNVEGESTCVDNLNRFIERHIFTSERLEERNSGRAENLKDAAIQATDNGYVVEMKIPLTEEAISAIKDNENVIGFLPQNMNAIPLSFGSNLDIGGNAAKWLLSTTNNKAVSLKLTEEAYVYVPGDVNGDTAVNAKDIVRLMQYIANDGKGVTVTKADLNNDGKENAKDIVRLMQYIANGGEGVEIF